MAGDGTRERPYDWRWGDPGSVCDEFHISKIELKKIYLDGWIKGRQVTWRDDEHRAQIVYCFEDIHRWLEEVAHRPTREYLKKFWSMTEVAETEISGDGKKGPYAR